MAARVRSRGRNRLEEEMAVRVSALAAVVLVLAASCGGSTPAPSGATPTPAAATCSGSGGEAVAVANFSFTPQSASVTKGTVVTWTNTAPGPHTVTFDGGPDCGQLAAGASVSRTFDTAGTFTYHCTIHPAMTGSVIVE